MTIHNFSAFATHPRTQLDTLHRQLSNPSANAKGIFDTSENKLTLEFMGQKVVYQLSQENQNAKLLEQSSGGLSYIKIETTQNSGSAYMNTGFDLKLTPLTANNRIDNSMIDLMLKTEENPKKEVDA